MKFVSFCIAACAGLLLGGIGGPAKAFAAAPIAEEPLLHARQLPSRLVESYLNVCTSCNGQ